MSPAHYNGVLSSLATETALPVLSINYCKAPEHPFPKALNQCFSLYKALVNSNGSMLGIEFSNILQIKLAGDSAGGNLACGVVLQSIASQMPVPAALCLLCPILTFKVQGWIPEKDQESLSKVGITSNSMESSLGFLNNCRSSSKIQISSRFKFYNDMVLSPEYLLGLALMYLRNYPQAEPDKDPLLSPICASDDLLSQFPSTYIQVGDQDPLFDDSIIFYTKLQQLGCAVSLDQLPGISHGYLQMTGLLPESKQALGRVSCFLKRLASRQ